MTTDLDPIIDLCVALFSPDTTWAAIQDSGLSLLLVPEDRDGFGGGARALRAVAREAGFAALRQPLVERALLPGFLLGAATGQDMLPPFLEGARHVAVSDTPGHVAGDTPPDMLFAADGAELRVVAPAPGTTTPAPGIDGLPALRLPPTAPGASPDGTLVPRDTATRTRRYLSLARAAEIAGAADRAVALTTVFLGERRQFGQPLSSFQALRHRLTDAMIAAQEVDALSLRIALELDQDPDGDHSAMFDALAIKAGQAADLVATETVQMHGGVGTTEEYLVSHLFRRLTRLALELQPEAALDRLSRRDESLLDLA